MRFLRNIILIFLVTALNGSIFSQEKLKEVFLNPPQDAKPRGYWVWGQGNFDYSCIGEELKSFKEMGLGGVDIYDLGITDPYEIIPSGPAFFSTEQLDGMVYALREAKKLGLRMGMSVSNGWNAGGDWTTLDEMSMNMLFWKDTIQGPAKVTQIGFPLIPRSFKKMYGEFKLFPLIGKDGFPEYYENVGLVAYPLTSDGLISDLKQVIRFDAKQIKGNAVDIQLPGGKWVVLRSVVTPMGQKMWAASDRSKGFIMDHFSQNATHHHFTHLFNRLEERLGSLKGSAMERLYLASFESEAAVEWSPKLSEEFFKLNGYNIEPYIPVLAGQKVVDDETTQRFMHDYRLTVSEMFVNNHYRQARKICHDHGVLLASESGGPGPPLHRVPTEDYKALGAVDIMRGEFWNMKQNIKDQRGGNLLSVVKNISGAAHVYGHKIVEMESFTSQGKHWRENPMELKKLADYAFCNGMTRVVYHTMPHSPKEAGLPGWSYGAGTHISPNLTWWTLSKPLHEYFARVSALLQQGNFVADVAYYKGEEVPNFSIGYKYEKENLGVGYDYDDINTDILLQTNEVVDGKIKLPCGMTYSLLVLPSNGKMNMEVLRKIKELLQKGATIIGRKPTTVYGLNNHKAREAEMKLLADQIWGATPAGKQIRKYGKGLIVNGYSEKDILSQKGIDPDFTVHTDPQTSKLDYIHRSTGSDDIYFVRNADSVAVAAHLQLRVKGMQPQLWNPATGEITPIAIYSQGEKGTGLPLHLEAFGSVFIVFSKEKPAKLHVTALSKSGKSIFPENFNAEPSDFQIISQSENSFLMSADDEETYELKLSDGTKRTVQTQKNVVKELTGPWDVRFTHGWGFDPIQQMDTLTDWVKHSNVALSHYSGLASYKLAFNISRDFLSADKLYTLDLGKVGEVARVFLNGEEAGISLFPPHQLSLCGLLREGENNLVIEVANTWLNQLIADSKSPVLQQRLRSNVNLGLTSSNGNNVQPLSSGLIGPVRIISKTKSISLR